MQTMVRPGKTAASKRRRGLNPPPEITASCSSKCLLWVRLAELFSYLLFLPCGMSPAANWQGKQGQSHDWTGLSGGWGWCGVGLVGAQDGTECEG